MIMVIALLIATILAFIVGYFGGYNNGFDDGVIYQLKKNNDERIKQLRNK